MVRLNIGREARDTEGGLGEVRRSIAARLQPPPDLEAHEGKWRPPKKWERRIHSESLIFAGVRRPHVLS